MSESENERMTLESGFPSERERTLSDYPRSVQIQAIAQAMVHLAREGHEPISPATLAEAIEALNPDSRKGIGEGMASAMEEEDWRVFAEHLPADGVELFMNPEAGRAETRSREILQEAAAREVNKRIVEPLLFGTGLLSLFAAIGAFLMGGLLIGLLFLVLPIAVGYGFHKARQMGVR